VANEARGDLFLSIHANAAHSRRVRGIETFFLSLDASDEAAGELALRENEALAAAGVAAAEPGDPLATILGDLIATEHMQESDELARLVQKSLAPPETTTSRGVKQAPFVVLMGVGMPATLVEIGFITHPEEERVLVSSRGQEDAADALARAVREFGRRYDARRGVGPTVATGAGGS
jgi:N-acetylmuramoyl-L-alanine amidase